MLTNCTGVYSGRIWSYTSDLLNLDNPCKIGKNLQEEPVSEGLEEAIEKSFIYHENRGNDFRSDKQIETAYRYGFETGANWQKEQFENNRLAACDRQTEEEAEIEQSFVMGIIEKEHRQPTFDDAIKYGMRLKEKEMQSTIELAEDHAMLAGMEKMKEEMMAKAIGGKIYETQARSKLKAVTTGNLSRLDYKVGDKVKVIVIKED